MPRPQTISDEQILEAARQVFLEKGISATTAEVARRAGIAEGSIFNRFETKHALFRAAMLPGFTEPPFLARLDQTYGEDPRDTLMAVGREAIEFFRTLLPLMLMGWSNAHACGLPEHFMKPDPPPLRSLARLTEFFAKQIKARKMRKHNPAVSARVFLGSIQSYAFFELLGKVHHRQPLTADEHLSETIALLWNGLKRGT
jgi:AcrR family transcriptional regulator